MSFPCEYEWDVTSLGSTYDGTVYSLTPDFVDLGANPNLITQEQYQSLVDVHEIV